MRIKRFIAPDMRTALRMVRDEQGPDAVILSNRPVEDGIEIVAATDYDESLAQQALRAALPSLPPMPAPVASPARVAAVELSPPLLAGEGRGGVARADGARSNPLPTSPSREGEEQQASRLGSLAALLTKPVAKPKAWTAPVAEAETAEPAVVTLSEQSKAKISESPIRGRAVFTIDGEPAPAPQPARAPKAETQVVVAHAPPDTSRFDAMMAALIPQGEQFAADALPPSPTGRGIEGEGRGTVEVPAHLNAQQPAVSAIVNAAASADPHPNPSPVGRGAQVAAGHGAQAAEALLPSPAGRGIEGEGRGTVEVSAHLNSQQPVVSAIVNAAASADPHPNPSPVGRGAQDESHLRIVSNAREADPGMLAMRDELATMRQLIERELGQLTVERLRGSPARAAVYDALMNYGCDESLAQTVAGRIDARLDPSQVREPMLAELARTLSVAHHEPLDDGGVIALVGPTGAGKTTTAAKLAARFAQRHRARDVALVTTDTERAGATEQLHILGRRLGVTVCEANGPEALNDALDQLADYPLVLVDTAGHGLRDRALLGQILWLRAAKRVRSLLVLPANTNAHDLGEVVRRYRPASPEGVVLTKLDETGRLGSALSVLVQHGLSLAYTTDGQQVPHDLAAADAKKLVATLEKVRRAADNPLGSLDSRSVTHPTEDRHAIAS